MKDRKRQLMFFSFFNHRGISRHLEKMAAKGWLLCKIDRCVWTYSRITPQKLHFTVTYCPEASAYDPGPSAEQVQFQEFCEHTGWQLACRCAQMQVFYSEEEDPLPIETEPELEIHAIHKTARSSYIPIYLISLIAGLLLVAQRTYLILSDPIGILVRPHELTIPLMMTILAILGCGELGSYFLWHQRAQKAAAMGFFLDPPDTGKFLLVICITNAVLFICYCAGSILSNREYAWVFLIAIGGLLCVGLLLRGISALMKRRAVASEMNMVVTAMLSFFLIFFVINYGAAIVQELETRGLFSDQPVILYERHGKTWVQYQEDLPLDMEELRDIDPQDYSSRIRTEGSPFLTRHTVTDWARFDLNENGKMAGMGYVILEVHQSWLYEPCLRWFLEENQSPNRIVREAEAAPWGADRAYQIFDDQEGTDQVYLLCYGNTLVRISFGWPVTREQMQIVGEKLG